MKYAIVSKQDENSIQIVNTIKKQLNEQYIYDEHHPELVISVGGDGSMLYSVHQYIDQLETVAFIGLHSGTLGFLTDYQKEDLQTFINDLNTCEFSYYNRDLLEVSLNNQVLYALNEFRVENNMRSQVMDVYINDEYLETFRGNGLCISTVSGSTAYNKSLGGAILYTKQRLMQLSEIAGIHHNAYRSLGSSLILDDSKTIRLRSQDFSYSVFGIDYLVYHNENIGYVDIQLSSRFVRFAQLKKVSLIERLKRSYL